MARGGIGENTPKLIKFEGCCVAHSLHVARSVRLVLLNRFVNCLVSSTCSSGRGKAWCMHNIRGRTSKHTHRRSPNFRRVNNRQAKNTPKNVE